MASIQKIDDIKIPVDSIADSGFENTLSFKPEILGEILLSDDIKALKPLDIHYVLTREGDMIHADINIKSEIETLCSICLGCMKYPIDITLVTDYLPAHADMQGDLEALRQSQEIGYYRKDICLGAFILSEMVLSMPIRYECRNGCKGLCPVCGVNLNEGVCSCEKKPDPRLEKLAILKTKLRRE
ncbi:MAG TPA: DUF177 domain-containing protein [Desulfomonilia bacterium]